MALAPAPGGTVYAAASGHGVSQLTLEGKMVASSSTEHRGLSLGTDAEGQVWLGGKGIYRVDRRGTLLDLTLENLGVDSAMAMKLDAAHETLWACNWQEILARKNRDWRHLTAKDGLNGLLNNFCQTLAVHPDGDVWFSYAGLAEFSLLKNAASPRLTIKNYTGGSDIGDAHTSFLDIDHRGWLWRGSDADYVASPKAAEAGDWIRLNSQDGIPAAWRQCQLLFRRPGRFRLVWERQYSRPLQTARRLCHAVSSSWSLYLGFTVGKAAPTLAEMTTQIPHGQDLIAHVGSLQFDRRNALRLRYRLLPEAGLMAPGTRPGPAPGQAALGKTYAAGPGAAQHGTVVGCFGTDLHRC